MVASSFAPRPLQVNLAGGHAEAEVDPASVRRAYSAHVRRVVGGAEAAAPQAAALAARGAFGVLRFAAVRSAEVLAPFLDVSVHVEESPGVRLLLSDGMRLQARVRLYPS